MSRTDDKRSLIFMHNRRLQLLKERQAYQGINVDPSVVMEIEDINARIGSLQAELTDIEDYDALAIRDLLLDSFSADGFEDFCREHFRPVYDQFTLEMTYGFKVQLLIDYCDRFDLYARLLERVRETRQGPYERHLSRLKVSAADISVFDASKSIPVQLALQFDLSNLTEALQYSIIRAIARIVRIPSEQIRILDVRSGSVFLTIEMPLKSAERLISAYDEQHAAIRDLQITGVETLRIRFDPYSLSLSMLSAIAALKSFTYLQFDEPSDKKKEHIIRQISHLARLIYESADLLSQFRGILSVNNMLHNEFWPGAAEILVSEGSFAAIDQMRSSAFRVGRVFPRILNDLRPYLAPQEGDQLDRVLSKVDFFLKEALLSPDYRRYLSSMRSSIRLIFDFIYDIGSVYEKDTSRLEKIFTSLRILEDWDDGEVGLDQIVVTKLKPSDTPPSNLIWRIPLVSDIAAGLGVIPEEKIERFVVLDDTFRGEADFGVRVIGDSMIGDGILPGDIALIRQQPKVEMGEIAAVIITTPTGSEGVLKKYHLAYAERSDLGHWFLASSNPVSEHIVVISSGADTAAIKALYEKAIRSGKMRVRYYEGAELAVAGKYVGVLRKEQDRSQSQATGTLEGNFSDSV